MDRPSVAVVTGASSGIGRATAIRLSQDFSALILVARDQNRLEGVEKEAKRNSAEVLTIDLDLTAPSVPEVIVSRTLERFGRIDALLNIAGAVPGIDLFGMTDEQWTAGMELKLHAARRLTMRCWKSLKESRGSVIFIAGTTAEVPTASAAAVGVVNAAVVALAKAFADQGLRDGVRVNTVSPGAVMTPRRLAMIENWAVAHHVSTEEASRTLLAQAGVARYGEAGDVANLMAYLVSPAARWITGTQMRIDGGEVKSI